MTPTYFLRTRPFVTTLSDNPTLPYNNRHTLLIGLTHQQQSTWTDSDALKELSELARTNGLEVIDTITQARETPHTKSYMGSGKIEEVLELIAAHEISIIIANDELTPTQSKYLNQTLKIKVLDRTSLILDIFSQRAQTYEAKLQIEYAQLDYLMPRLTRLWTHLSRLGGGIGTRGPGETQLEVDKRQIRTKMGHINRQLKRVQKRRHLTRLKRKKTPAITGAIVGYTNAGKSTLMTALTQADILSEDLLFATLDPTTRRLKLPNNEEVVVSDTVGFIQKLPTHLVKAFYSTLEEVSDADFLLHVVDASHPNMLDMIATSEKIIRDLGAHETPCLYVLNKSDQIKKPNQTRQALKAFQPQCFISALDSDSVATLIPEIETMLSHYQTRRTYRLTYQQMSIVNQLHEHGKVHDIEYLDTEIIIDITINTIKADKLLNAAFDSPSS